MLSLINQFRFPNDELMSSFVVLGLSPVSLMSETKVDQYGEKKLEHLTDGKVKSVTWTSNGGERQTATSDPRNNSRVETVEEDCFGKTISKRQNHFSVAAYLLIPSRAVSQ